MNTFASGPKKTYYGKGDIIAYRLEREGQQPAGTNPVFGANVKLLIHGDAFWPTYTTGDNTGLIATDSMKNFVQRETINFAGHDLPSYCRFLGEKFLSTYPQAEGAQITAERIPYAALDSANVAFEPAGPDREYALLEFARQGDRIAPVEMRGGIRGFRLLRLNGSAFHGFVRDQYTTLPDIRNRPLHMWLDLDWSCPENLPVAEQARSIVRDVFAAFQSGSIQQIIYQMGQRILSEIPSIAEVRLEANNRTWDTIAEQGDALGVYTDARPPYGCLGLTLRR